MTLYFRRVKLRNPFKPSHKAYFEIVLGAEAERKKKAERAAKKAEIKRAEKGFGRGQFIGLLRPMIEPSIKAEGEAGIDGDEDEVIRDEEGEQSEEIWEGDWTSIFEYYE
ncbi:hypothetical protein SNOG_03398 [Parastagonospora nodorum SN15]|uniref:Uncharacterized protein n=1 Tax=Phaeosphaeria nodorum (strain SN15 / ATCC MYA-4574 / FGSC 10173) TaxID=321614 RepID=Q0UXW6_PHANO|nr:hypothetical protein SNOG_03398 [Parastagonospora nodorum SN15]EAT88603.2 hypothetical protein SNOG_03398 [Parastagonospora nodorum SN15]